MNLCSKFLPNWLDVPIPVHDVFAAIFHPRLVLGLNGQTVTAGAGTFPSVGESTDISTNTPLFRYLIIEGYPNFKRNIEKRMTIKKDFMNKTHLFSIFLNFPCYALVCGRLDGLTNIDYTI